GNYYSVNYEPTGREGGLQIGVTHTLWVPQKAKRIRGIIIHQHGCGVGACKSGETAAYDIHWQALAAKWDCALLGPSYRQAAEQSCRLWCDPRNGSADVLIHSLKKLAHDAQHPEIATAPWCLWGHSGGGFWASLLQMQYPERIVSIWFQSGTAYGYWKKGETETPAIPPAAMQIPMMANPGLKEKDHERFHVAWDYSLAMFRDYRSQGAPIAFTPDPSTGHDTGDSRYLAIAFFDTTLRMRLPAKPGRPLKQIDQRQAYLASPDSNVPVPADQFEGDNLKASWLPDQTFASKWFEFIKTGAVADRTPPPAVKSVRVLTTRDGILVSWKTDADLESGIRQFVILRNGEEVGRLPETLPKKPYRNLYQGKTYGDTPVAGFPKPEFLDVSGRAGDQYKIISINSVGLESR
ncbi:MAG: hypothetical protein VX776_01385, partial [Planctomycetota bacterium]|nr:hypothetical protein [Planctomycetota bacterium]MEC9095249.1 hypothetical protein [Planctomycetota bacterium]